MKTKPETENISFGIFFFLVHFKTLFDSSN